MDASTLLSGVGYSRWLLIAVAVGKYILSQTCIKAKCDTDKEGHPQLRLTLNASQRDLAEQHPDVLDRVQQLEQLFAEKATKGDPAASVSPGH